ncbi:phosphatase PAP2 family protein [Streptomyces sp. NPDC002181]|uniref:phosphatase PAP2 family protein n=1 Tax=Streptomyces sp. NPDC002181 TaxID=3364635 RepID=UPI0036CF2252
MFLAVSVAAQSAVFVLVTLVVERPRPDVPHLDAAPPTSSFPSGHVGASVALFGGLAVLAAGLLNGACTLLVVAYALLPGAGAAPGPGGRWRSARGPARRGRQDAVRGAGPGRGGPSSARLRPWNGGERAGRASPSPVADQVWAQPSADEPCGAPAARTVRSDRRARRGPGRRRRLDAEAGCRSSRISPSPPGTP